MAAEMWGRIPPPPDFDPGDEVKVGRYMQWLGDTVLHIHRCVEDVKARVDRNFAQEQQRHADIKDRIESHEQTHENARLVDQGRKQMLAFQAKLLDKAVKIATSGATLGVAVAVVKLLDRFF